MYHPNTDFDHVRAILRERADEIQYRQLVAERGQDDNPARFRRLLFRPSLRRPISAID